MLRHCVALKIVVMNNIIVLCNISLRACCSRLVSLAEKELTTDSNCFGKERHGVILKVQLSTKAIWTNKKACLACPSLHPCKYFTKMFSFFSSQEVSTDKNKLVYSKDRQNVKGTKLPLTGFLTVCYWHCGQLSKLLLHLHLLYH